ncbi:melanization protease 1-like [Photinus pyralis]|uniref:Peptidase S1 domain-containing protein n=2 Tax=Photinus pyralis TaxID=7054 RepID=A0A1Y1NCQ8_PHOPY|nr:melanization protease 1-like [Photinus pyralis]
MQHTMHAKYVILVITFKILIPASMQCHLNRETVSTKHCIPGRRFYARLDHLLALSELFSKQSFSQAYAFPWIVQITAAYMGASTLCTGTLINDRYVITSKKCCKPPLRPEHLTIALGYTEYESNVIKVSPCYIRSPVTNIILHPDYDSSNVTQENDIALLKIEPVIYTKTIYPIKLPDVTDKYKPLSKYAMEMVGYVRKNATPNKSFTTITLKPSRSNKCISDVHNKNATSNIICADITEASFMTSCSITSGMPILIEKPIAALNLSVLAGVLSSPVEVTNQCRLHGREVIAVKIVEKLSWILENTRDANYCKG